MLLGLQALYTYRLLDFIALNTIFEAIQIVADQFSVMRPLCFPCVEFLHSWNNSAHFQTTWLTVWPVAGDCIILKHEHGLSLPVIWYLPKPSFRLHSNVSFSYVTTKIPDPLVSRFKKWYFGIVLRDEAWFNLRWGSISLKIVRNLNR